jgi:hypothetical protein
VLTKNQRARLAREARRLASDIVEGRAPHLNAYSYCECAIGEIAARVGLPYARQNGDVAESIERAAFGSCSAIDENALVSWGLKFSNPGGAVFPLLALADALAAEPARSTSDRPPEDSK